MKLSWLLRIRQVNTLPCNGLRQPVCALAIVALAGLIANAEPRILIVGDSWSTSVWAPRALDEVLSEYGLGDVETVGNATAVAGSTASQWATLEWRAVITQQLAAHPTIDSVHLMIGGNDLLARIKNTNVYSGLAQFQRDGWWNDIRDDVQMIVEHCLLHPQIDHVVIAGYDYLNRWTIQNYFALLGQNWDFGGMSQLEVNSAFVEVGIKMYELAAATPGCDYVQNWGLLQHHFNTPAGSPRPGVCPGYQPWPGGTPHFAMPDAAFDIIWFGALPFPGDGLHPNTEAHKVMLRNAVEQFYLHWYGPPRVAPVITTNGGADFVTNNPALTLEGACETGIDEIRVNGATTGVLYTPGTTTWSYTTSLTGQGATLFTVNSWITDRCYGNASSANSIKVTFVSEGEGELIEGELEEGEGEGPGEGEPPMEGETDEGEPAEGEGEPAEGEPEEGEGEGPVEGEGEGELAFSHPADINEDFQMVLSEAIAYLAGWQQGSNLMGHAIRAVYLWQNGEQYYYDTGQDPPLCWDLVPLEGESVEGEDETILLPGNV